MTSDEGARAKGHLCGSDVETAWKEMKDCILEADSRACGIARRKGVMKRTKWWNEEVRCAVKKRK